MIKIEVAMNHEFVVKHWLLSVITCNDGALRKSCPLRIWINVINTGIKNYAI